MAVTPIAPSDTFNTYRTRTNSLIDILNALGESSAITITGGTIDGVSIGATNPFTGVFTSLTVNGSLNVSSATLNIADGQIPGEKVAGGTTSLDTLILGNQPTSNSHATRKDYVDGLIAGLGSAAQQPSSAFATAAQGAKADTAVQPGQIGTAASRDVGSGATQVPLNSNLGTAAYVATGTANNQVPLNSQLADGARTAVGTSGNVLGKLNTANTWSATQTFNEETKGSTRISSQSLPSNNFNLAINPGVYTVNTSVASTLNGPWNFGATNYSGVLEVIRITGSSFLFQIYYDMSAGSSRTWQRRINDNATNDTPWISHDNERIVTANTGSAYTCNYSQSQNYALTLTANCTLSFSNPPQGSGSINIRLTKNAANRTIIWPESVKWPNGIVPNITSASGSVDIFTFITFNGGSEWFGFLAGENMQ